MAGEVAEAVEEAVEDIRDSALRAGAVIMDKASESARSVAHAGSAHAVKVAPAA